MRDQSCEMYYYENLPISGIATCFDLPACRVDEILTQTVGSLRTEVLGAFKSGEAAAKDSLGRSLAQP